MKPSVGVSMASSLHERATRTFDSGSEAKANEYRSEEKVSERGGAFVNTVRVRVSGCFAHTCLWQHGSKQVVDYLAFLSGGLSQTLASLAALKGSEGTAGGRIVYDPGGVARVKGFLQSYLLGRSEFNNGEEVLGLFSGGRVSQRTAALPGGEVGRVLGGVRDLIVDSVCGCLTVADEARRQCGIERRLCR